MPRSGETLVVRWVDRLGRDYRDVADTIRAFMHRGGVVRTVINGMVFDGATKDPMQPAVRDALIAFMAARAQAQADAGREAQKAGIEHARARNRRRPRAQAELRPGTVPGGRAPAGARQRIRDDRAEAEAVLARWALRG